MIQRLVFHAPISALSLGQVSFNLLREFYRRKVQVQFWPIGQPDFSPFKVDPQFGAWIEQSVNSRFTKLDRKLPSLRVWHLNGAEAKLTDRQWTLSFHETDSPTESEVNIANQQEETLFCSTWSVDNFRTFGATRVSFVPLGHDEDFQPVGQRLVSPDITHWVLGGTKIESRKNSQMIIQTWVKRYGGRREHQLTLCVTNPFLQPQQMDQFYASCFPNGQKPFNVNILPRLKTNAEMAQLYNSADVCLAGFSSGESWNLPSFTTTALGKWSIVTNCSGHKDWATAENAILVEPTGMRPAADGVFFSPTGPWSQGNIYAFTAEQLEAAMERAEKVAKTPNPAGARLRETHTYAKTVDAILAKIEQVSV
jgi:hypothetical protein